MSEVASIEPEDIVNISIKSNKENIIGCHNNKIKDRSSEEDCLKKTVITLPRKIRCSYLLYAKYSNKC